VPGGTVITNVAHVIPDVDGDGTPDAPVSTNPTNNTVNDNLLVSITDTKENTGGDGINDGLDDDGDNDIQLVDQASSGDSVIFKNVVENLGNVNDVLELSINNISFPSGTVFTFWNDAQTVQLSDSNGVLGVDAGVVVPGTPVTITVAGLLPSGASGVGPYDAEVTVTSATNQSVTDTVIERLDEIIASTVDIHNASGGALGTDDNPLGAPEYAAVNTATTDVNTTVNIPLYIDNDGASSDSFQLAVGSVYDAATDTVSGLPAGWTVEFFESDGAGSPVGAPISTTPSVPGLTADYEIIAVVTVPADQAQAIGDFVIDNDADGTDETLDSNGDGDGDFPLFFQINSTNTGATDTTLEAVDVNAVVAASLTPNGSEQIAPGGSESYDNTLSNNGNATATYEVSASNSQTGWTSTVSIDTDGDGVADTELGNLIAGTIQVQQPDGTVATIEVAISAFGSPELTLDAGEQLPIESTVYSPSTAPAGQFDVLTITAMDIDSGDIVSAQNQTQVVLGQVNIVKTVGIDTDCDGVSDDGTFAATPSAQIEPGQCLVWQIVAQNQGTADALNVQIRDAAPAFTTFVPGSLHYCLNQNCVPAVVSDAVRVLHLPLVREATWFQVTMQLYNSQCKWTRKRYKSGCSFLAPPDDREATFLLK